MAGPKYLCNFIKIHETHFFFKIRILFVQRVSMMNGEEYCNHPFERLFEECIIACRSVRQRARARHEEIIYYCNLCEKCATIHIA